jgi:hypothetical protein
MRKLLGILAAIATLDGSLLLRANAMVPTGRRSQACRRERATD